MQLVEASNLLSNLQREFDSFIQKIKEKESPFYISQKYKINISFEKDKKRNNKRKKAI